MNERVVAAIDGNSLMHRAFHAVQTPMNSPDGRPTNACFGFMSMLLKLISDFKPAGIIVAFDAGIPQSRFEAIEAYKAQRPPTDPDLKIQFPMMEALLVSLNIPVVRVQDFEGDDILGTLSARAEEEDSIKMLLISGDKDVLQLATDKTNIVTTRIGMSDVKIYDPEGVKERFGVDPAHVPDFLGLMGDSSDNIPGIPGVGEKTATKLLQEYGDIEGVIAHAGELKGKLAERVSEGAQLALDSRKVATIIRDVPLEITFDDVIFPNFDSEKVKQAFVELGMMSQLRKLLKLAGDESAGEGLPATIKPRASATPVTESLFGGSGDSGDASSNGAAAAEGDGAAAAEDERAQADKPETVFAKSLQRIVTGAEALEAVQKLLNSAEQKSSKGQLPLGVHLENPETAALSKSGKAQQSIMFDVPEEEAAPANLFVALDDCVAVLSGTEAQDILKNMLLSKTDIACFSFKELLRFLVPPNTAEEALLTYDELYSARATDLSVAFYLLDSDRATDNPVSIIERFAPFIAIEGFQELQDKKESDEGDNAEPSQFMAALAAAARALSPALLNELAANQAELCYQEIEQPVTSVLVAMERDGVKIDTAVLGTQNQELSIRIDELRAQALEIAGMEFNLDSPKQVGEVLFEKLMLPPKKKTKSGYSTDASVLAELAPLSPLPGIILEYRELAKLRSTYLEALPKLIAEDGLIHTSFNQTVTATGRLSSSDPNLQNIPVRSDLGRHVRTAFVADAQAIGADEAVFVSADYSQIELRLLAHLSEDEHLIAAFISGEDFHRATAARVFGVKTEDVTSEMRGRAKAVNFGIVYGQQAFGLAQSLGIGFGEAGEMIQRYFEAYPQVQEYLESLKVKARENGWVDTIYGRRRQIAEVRSSNPTRRGYAERTAMNHPMQGTAADIVKLAMIKIAQRLEQDGYRSRMVLQVHDELDFNCDVKELEKLTLMVTEEMQGVIKLKVPLIADVSSGPNWAIAH